MEASRPDRVRDLRTEGWSLLEAGRVREAADAFGRVALLAPADAEARRGLERARTALAEENRVLDELIDEALRALDGGDRDRARGLLEDVVRRGGDRDRARSLLDRLEERPGRIDVGVRGETTAPPPRAATQPRSTPRRLFVVAWACLFALLAAGVAVSWERLVENLVRAPSPHSSPSGTAARGAAP